MTLLMDLACALSIQVGNDLFNDVGDAMRGNDGQDRLGPRRVTAAGLASPHKVKRAAVCSFVAALLLGVYLLLSGAGRFSRFGWPLFSLAEPIRVARGRFPIRPGAMC